MPIDSEANDHIVSRISADTGWKVLSWQSVEDGRCILALVETSHLVNPERFGVIASWAFPHHITISTEAYSRLAGVL